MPDETVEVIETNIDDMNPQLYEHVIDKLFANGALDVYLTNIIMKKGRPGIKLTALSKNQDTARLSNIILSETTSIGVRVYPAKRRVLEREIKELDTKYGKIKVKISKLQGKVKNMMPEFEDCRRAAERHKVPIKKIYEELGSGPFSRKRGS